MYADHSLTHVWFGARDRCDGHTRSNYTRHVEVSKMDVSARVQEHVGWLHVTVDHQMLSQVLQSEAQFSHVESDPR